MEDNMYDHDDDAFSQFVEGLEGGNPIFVNLPIGETLVVNGPRQTPLVITISNKVERNPKRDARMLSTFLSCSLDEQTVFHLAEYLFAEHIAPMMKDPRATSMDEYLAPVAKPVRKKSPPKEELKDEHTD
jgi:hypothetical protein